MNQRLYELFVLKCAPIQAAVEAALANYDSSLVRENANIRDDPLIRNYVSQIPLSDQLEAERMSEYYKLFYALENYIRDFISSVIEEEAGDDWWESKVPEVIRHGAQRARQRELEAGVTPRSVDMLEYATFGELTEIVKANMALFAGFFPSPKGFENVMARLNTVRGPIMHCGSLAEDEVLRLKLSVRDWFKLSEVPRRRRGQG